MTNYFKDKFYMADHLHMQPSEIENLPFYEFVEFRNLLADKLKKQEEHNRKSKDESSKQSYKPPKTNIPKFKMPKLR